MNRTTDQTSEAMTDGAPSPMGARMDGRLRNAIVAVAAVGAAFTVLAALGWSLRTAWSVGVGAAIATANLWVLARVIGALLPREGEDAPPAGAKGWGFIALLKMLGLFVGVWILMSRHLVDPLPMLVGFGALPIGIAIGSIVSDRTAARK